MLPKIKHENIRYTRNIHSSYIDSIHHIYVSNYDNLNQFVSSLPNLTSITFQPSSESVNYNEVIASALQHCQLTRIHFEDIEELEIPTLAEHQIQQLSIKNCNVSNLEAVVKECPELVELELSTLIEWKRFPSLTKLEYLSIVSNNEVSFVGLNQSKQLKHLILKNSSNSHLGDDVAELQNLEKIELIHLKNLTAIPNFKSLKFLKHFTLHSLTKVTELPTFETLNKLTTIDFNQIKFNFSQLTSQSKNLKRVSLNAVSHIPEELNQCKKIEYLTIYNYTKELPDFQNLTKIKELKCNDLLSTTFQLVLPVCRILDLSSCPNIKTIPPVNHQYIKEIRLYGLDSLEEVPLFTKKATNLTTISYSNLEQIKELPSSYSQCPKLKWLRVNTNLTKFPEGFEKTALKTLNVYSDKINIIPNAYYQFGGELNVNFYDEIYSRSKNFRYHFELMKKNGRDNKEAIFYWLRQGFREEEFTDSLKEKTILAYNTHHDMRVVIEPYISYLNVEQKIVESNDISSNKTVYINGKTNNSTRLKNKLKERGCKVVQKFTESVDVIILGAKPKFESGMLAKHIIYALQYQVEEIIANENPDRLQQEDIPAEYLEQLRNLLRSGDPINENVALVMAKAHGLPKELEYEFIYSSKTCKDKNLKNRIRNFLKGKLSKEKAKIVSANVEFSARYFTIFPFISDLELAELFYSQYLRTNSKPEKLTITVNENFNFESIYSNQQLIQLSLNIIKATSNVQLPEGISQLKHLKKLYLETDNEYKILVPNDISDLNDLDYEL